MNDREEWICANIGLVHACAKRFTGRGMEYDDLFQAGCMGLVKAADGFDESRGLKFSTYAVPVILGEMRRLFRDGGTVKVSRSLKELALRATREREGYIHREGREPTIGELADLLGVDAEQAAEQKMPADLFFLLNEETLRAVAQCLTELCIFLFQDHEAVKIQIILQPLKDRDGPRQQPLLQQILLIGVNLMTEHFPMFLRQRGERSVHRREIQIKCSSGQAAERADLLDGRHLVVLCRLIMHFPQDEISRLDGTLICLLRHAFPSVMCSILYTSCEEKTNPDDQIFLPFTIFFVSLTISITSRRFFSGISRNRSISSHSSALG